MDCHDPVESIQGDHFHPCPALPGDEPDVSVPHTSRQQPWDCFHDFQRTVRLRRDNIMKPDGPALISPRFRLSMSRVRSGLVSMALFVMCALQAAPGGREIPEVLRPWETWATWKDEHRNCPTPYSDPNTHRCFWPSRLSLNVEQSGARFELGVSVFGPTWLPLPGGSEAWPAGVRANGVPIPVLEHEGNPAVQLTAGTVRLEGSFQWSEMPQRLRLPREIGILDLTLAGQKVDSPTWDAQGLLWLKRDGAADEGEKNFLSVKLYSVLEDGIPLWLRREVELVVSGKSREEDLGAVLPEGWKLAVVESPLPVAVDDAGRMKAQVRAGKWTLRADAFRLDDPKEFRYAAGARPAVAEELIAFRAQPDFRVLEVIGPPSVDVSQTAFPEKWRDLPVYRWDTAIPFRLDQRMRGMGDQKPAGLTINREWWLDEGGLGLTFRDQITGAMQQIWRLDVAEGEDLGSVRSGGQGQLITRNPQNGAAGVEIRTRNLDLEATGRMARPVDFPATGWRSDADALDVTLHLPPGWRLFALFGADWVRGDWLTAWSLLDLFLLLIFSLAVFRLWGVGKALLAFVAFALAYHEPGAPRYVWLVLLIPLALQHRVPAGWGRRLLVAGKWAAVGALVFVLVPFVARQVQQALYPQLEVVDPSRGRGWGGFAVAAKSKGMSAPRAEVNEALSPRIAMRYNLSSAAGQSLGVASTASENLSQDAKARIQTGPAVPEWTWRAVRFGWNGPVQAAQRVRPVLIPLPLERGLTVLRVGLLLVLASVLLRMDRPAGTGGVVAGKAAVLGAILFVFGLLPNSVQAQAAAASPADARVIPDAATLQLLRERLLAPSDAYPNAANIASVSLTLTDRRLIMEAEIHTALRTAVPLPGRMPVWSPLTVLVDDRPEVALRRDDGFLWVVLPEGVHRVRVEGMLASLGEWEWPFLLKPRRVTIQAPGWTFSGVRSDGVPEQQIFFAPQQRAAASQATYERQDLQPIVAIDRRLELGLIWQVRTVVTRLSPLGKAVALRVPLLPGENVFSPNAVVRDGFLEVRLGAQEPSSQWESGLTLTNRLGLATRAGDSWVERWHLVASPVWNVALSGLAPIFEPANADLVPVWKPWPGEAVTLAISRPEAVAGTTVTVNRASHEISLGKRQRVSKLDLSLRCSLGEDFSVELPADTEITDLTHNGNPIPVRLDGRKLVIPLRPGEQTLSIGWKINSPLGLGSEAGEVRLPVGSANIQTVITVPDDRWVLWASGPRRGPAVRFWGILICSLLAAGALGRIRPSPLRTVEWMLLVIGLTQVPLPAALIVVGWLFLLMWRGQASFQRLGLGAYNFLQAVLVLLTAVALGILLVAVGEGLLGSPEMFITGNDSSRTVLRWFQDRSEAMLPQPRCLSVSIWWYRFFMLAWALWLASALIRWLQMGWRNFAAGGFFRHSRKAPVTPPPLAPAA